MAWDDIPEWATTVTAELLEQLKQKDEFTYLHCCRVGRGSRKLAKALSLNEFEQAILEYAGLFHDLGKVQIPDSILLKPGRLDRAEIEVMKSHPDLSAQMIQHLDHNAFFRFMIPGVKFHHERMEGDGYPNAIKGEDIPLSARLIAVVDAYDAMTSARSYRNPLGKDKAIAELKAFSNKQFDKRIVDEFLKLLPELEKSPHEESKEELIVASLIKRVA